MDQIKGRPKLFIFLPIELLNFFKSWPRDLYWAKPEFQFILCGTILVPKYLDQFDTTGRRFPLAQTFNLRMNLGPNRRPKKISIRPSFRPPQTVFKVDLTLQNTLFSTKSCKSYSSVRRCWCRFWDMHYQPWIRLL